MSDLPEGEARAELRACCAATRWVERMLSQRPFKNREEVFESAEHIWWQMGRADWLEAFGGHPRIGEQTHRRTAKEPHSRTAAQPHSGRAEEWAEKEQAGVAAADHVLKAALAEANRAYEERFGYIYIVCATGRSGEEILALARQRLANDTTTELRVAAAEQLAITKLRLEKLLTI